MNDRSDDEAIIDRLRNWLDSVRANGEGFDARELALDAQIGPPPREFGIIDLVEEFTALRHELKLQTKSGRGLIDQTETTVATLKQATEQFRSAQTKDAQAVWKAATPLAEALADLDEALVRGQREIERARRLIADESVRELENALDDLHRRQSWVRRRLLRSFHQQVIETVRLAGRARHDLFDSFLEGYSLIQKRLGRVLAAEQIEHISCLGKPVDPERMMVIEVVDEPRDQPGTVVKELRRGYTWQGRVIRYAEVQAARGAWKSTVEPEADGAADLEEDDSDVEVELDQENRTHPARLGSSKETHHGFGNDHRHRPGNDQ
jgi:molecular chaperone GrpE